MKESFLNSSKENINYDPSLLIEKLGELQERYLNSNNEDIKRDIAIKQQEFVRLLRTQLDKFYLATQDTSISQEEKDKLMGQYGMYMDQMAILLPWSELINGKERDIQQEAKNVLLSYSSDREISKDIAFSLFMLHHHGVDISKDLTIKAYESYGKKKDLPVQFAKAYIEEENKAKKYLQIYASIVFSKENFSLEKDYEQIKSSKEEFTDEEKHCLEYIENYINRVIYYTNIVNNNTQP